MEHTRPPDPELSASSEGPDMELHRQKRQRLQQEPLGEISYNNERGPMSESPTTQTGEIEQAVDSQLEAAQEQAADHEPHMGEGEFNNAQDQVHDQIDQGDHGDMGEGEFDRNTDDEDDQGDGEVPMGFSRTDFELEELSDIAQLDDMKIAMGFIRAIENASLDDDDCRLGEEAIDRLRHPPQQPVDIDSPDLRLGLDLFNSLSNSSQETYTSVRQAILRRHPEDNIPSYDQIKRRVAEITGVVSIVHDMCVNTCIAFTGPFSQLDSCPKCGQPRYDPTILANSSGEKKVVRQEFHTIPIGPQLQALWRSEESATSMHYAEIRTKEILKELEINEGVLESYEDVVNGSDYLEAVSSGRIGPHDALLMFSLDGAQLHKNKASDCWIGIWIVFNLSPDSRYKIRRVLPGFFIPGPNKPKNTDSFGYPSLHHLAAIQNEGLTVWDASLNGLYSTKPFFVLGTADAPGVVHLNGLVGHHGKIGCRLYCPLRGRHKPGGPHYYPALLKPRNYNVAGCDHNDVDVNSISGSSVQKYQENLRFVMASANQTQFENHRLEMGICKPSIYLGISPKNRLSVPGCFPGDIMHLVSLNIPDLFFKLWRGLLDCQKPDNRATWDWAVLQGDVWKAHGKTVAAATPYLPGSFDRPPRNPAEKISSGYKAWEFLMYLIGLGPGLFYNVLPEKYWMHFCKLVFAIRIIGQYTIRRAKLIPAHKALLEFVKEFELLYYQQRVERLHFIRQSIHALLHLATEVIRVGPPACSSQWTMERTIGNLTREIRQPSNLYANLSQRGVHRCQINALKAMVPDFEPEINLLPRGAKDLNEGYVLLRAKEKSPRPLKECDAAVLAEYLRDIEGQMIPNDWHPSVSRWARLRLPNGQVARSAWKENEKCKENVRMARNVKFNLAGGLCFAEVQYYLHLNISGREKAVAVVSVYSPPHAGLLKLSHNTLWSSTYHGDAALTVVDVKKILAVVAMVPHQPLGADSVGRFFVVEKPGLDVAHMGGNNEVVSEE